MFLALGFFATSCGPDKVDECLSDLTDAELTGTFVGTHTLGLSNVVIEALLLIVNKDQPDSLIKKIQDIKFFKDTLVTTPAIVLSELLDLELPFNKGCKNELIIPEVKKASIVLAGGLEVKNAKIVGTATVADDVITTKLKISGSVAGITIPPTDVKGTFTRYTPPVEVDNEDSKY